MVTCVFFCIFAAKILLDDTQSFTKEQNVT